MPFPLTLEFCSPPSISSHSGPTISCYCLIQKGSGAIFFITLSIIPWSTLSRAILSDHKFCALTLLWQLLLMMINNYSKYDDYFDLLELFFCSFFYLFCCSSPEKHNFLLFDLCDSNQEFSVPSLPFLPCDENQTYL